MKHVLRYSISGVVGFIITMGLFIGMLNLLSSKKPPITGTDNNINFSFVKDYKEPVIEPKTPKEPPVQEMVEQPPAASKLTLDIHSDPIPANLPGLKEANRFNVLGEISLPGNVGNFNADNPGTIKAAIAPMYPQQPLINKTEGWVKVQISINEFGTVSAVSILDAEPARVFNAAAKKAVKKWKFHPKTVGGKAVSFKATQTIEFKIDQ